MTNRMLSGASLVASPHATFKRVTKRGARTFPASRCPKPYLVIQIVRQDRDGQSNCDIFLTAVHVVDEILEPLEVVGMEQIRT